MRSPDSLTAEARRILRLAWPVVMTSLNWTLLQVTDVAVVGQAGTHEVAGFGASRAITFITIVAAIGALSGVLVQASRADGAGDKAETGEVLRRGLLLGLLLGVAGLVLMFLGAEPLLRLIGVSDAVLPIAVDVVRVMAFAFPAQMIVIAASNFLEGVSQPRRVMVVNLSLLPANAVLAWALAGGHLGLPMLGAFGAGLATTIVIWLGALLMVQAARRVPDADVRNTCDISLTAWKRALPGVGALASFGLVPAIASGLELAGFSYLIALSTQLGDVTSHAFQIVFSLHNVTFAVALGLGSAAGVRAGNAVGEGGPHLARNRTYVAVGLAFLLEGVMALALIVGGAAIVTVFPAELSVLTLAAAMLAIWAPFIIFDGLQVVFMFALRSLGDQIAAGINGILAFFVVTGGTGWWLVREGWGADALVFASGFGMLAAAILNGGRFAQVTARLSAAARPKSSG